MSKWVIIAACTLIAGCHNDEWLVENSREGLTHEQVIEVVKKCEAAGMYSKVHYSDWEVGYVIAVTCYPKNQAEPY